MRVGCAQGWVCSKGAGSTQGGNKVSLVTTCKDVKVGGITKAGRSAQPLSSEKQPIFACCEIHGCYMVCVVPPLRPVKPCCQCVRPPVMLGSASQGSPGWLRPTGSLPPPCLWRCCRRLAVYMHSCDLQPKSSHTIVFGAAPRHSSRVWCIRRMVPTGWWPLVLRQACGCLLAAC
jgi:hypothetical protein